MLVPPPPGTNPGAPARAQTAASLTRARIDLRTAAKLLARAYEALADAANSGRAAWALSPSEGAALNAALQQTAVAAQQLDQANQITANLARAIR